MCNFIRPFWATIFIKFRWGTPLPRWPSKKIYSEFITCSPVHIYDVLNVSYIEWAELQWSLHWGLTTWRVSLHACMLHDISINLVSVSWILLQAKNYVNKLPRQCDYGMTIYSCIICTTQIISSMIIHFFSSSYFSLSGRGQGADGIHEPIVGDVPVSCL
jgi:hypothetical protein